MEYNLVDKVHGKRNERKGNIENMYAKSVTGTKIKKSEDNDELIKGGEGSKGGKVIGHTKSGKAIYDKHNHTEHEHFTADDHTDAKEAHVKLIMDHPGADTSDNATQAKKHIESTMKENRISGHVAEHHEKYGKMDDAGKRKYRSQVKTTHDVGSPISDKDDRDAQEKFSAHKRFLDETKGDATKIGKTASGKDIHTSHGHEAHKEFDADDHLDAFHAHMSKRNEEKKNIVAKHTAGEKPASFSKEEIAQLKAINSEMTDSKVVQHHDTEMQKHLNSYGAAKGVIKKSLDSKAFGFYNGYMNHYFGMNDEKKIQYRDQAKQILKSRFITIEKSEGSVNNYDALEQFLRHTDPKISKSEQDCLDVMFEKGEIADCIASGYGAGSEPITFVKTGKDIKEKVPAIKAALTVQIATVEAQLSALKTQIGKDPTSNNTRRYDKNTVFFRYDYNLTETAYVNGQYAERTEENNLCTKYNTLAYLWCEIKDDFDAVNVMENNLEDSKKYTLSVSQLIALNFN